MAVLIDTDVLVDSERSASAPNLDRLLGGEELAISVITVSELLHGAQRESAYRRTPRRAFVEALLAAFDPIPVAHYQRVPGLRGLGPEA